MTGFFVKPETDSRIVWTPALRDAALGIANDAEFTPGHWPETWQSVRERSLEMARHIPVGEPLGWRADLIQCMRSRAKGFHPAPESFDVFEALWSSAYKEAK